MNNINIPINKIKTFFTGPIFRAFLVSLLTVLITLGIIVSIVWHYRARVFKILAQGYVAELMQKPQAPNEATIQKDVLAALPVALPEAVPAQTESVVSAVKIAKPAVVSIVIYKDVPKYDVSYEQNNDITSPLGSLFPGSFFQVPVYTQNGTEHKKVGSGSGFIISSDGLIVTNRHVVADKDATYEVLLNNGTKYTGKVLARDSVYDVALMKITASGLPYLSLGDSDTLDVGQSVVAIGNALGEFKNSVSAGVISGLSRDISAGDNYGSTERLDKVIQTDAAINPGNSGGPLLDLSGKVVGINVAVAQGSSNIGFALPINSVKKIINQVSKTGKIVRPYVGLRYTPINADLKAKNNLPVDYGILVKSGATDADLAVIPGSPANKAGIVENDIILEVDGKKIDQDQDFSFLIRNRNVGDAITLKVLSKGVTKIVTLRLEQAPDNL